MAYKLPDLPYAVDALEPYIDAQTLPIHHGKHHASYVNNLNKALEGHSELSGLPLEALLQRVSTLPSSIQTAVRNNGGGHFGHCLYWASMAPGVRGRGPSAELSKAIEKDLGGLEAFKDGFSKLAATHFASGWAWLCVGNEGKLFTCSTPNHDSPLMTGIVDRTGTPILCVDVWEHAYYLKYQNRRPEYVGAWWNLVDWEAIERRYVGARSGKPVPIAP